MDIHWSTSGGYKVIDNYLPLEDFEVIQRQITGDDQVFPWYYNKFVDNRSKGETHDHFYFCHVVYNDNKPNSDYYNTVLPLINKINPISLIRIKANGYPKNGDKITKYNYHTDYRFKHKGAIFYLNTNNAKTILEDGTEIDSVENRILFFDPSMPHTCTNATDVKMRFNININYL